ncbi:putative membrane protein [Cryptosporidium felis]|nr:putative membrane protein [Cryptosporidium felis]
MMFSSILETARVLNFEEAFSKRGLLSTIVGIILGLIVSTTVNATLVEISLSPFFSTYFGLLFIVIGSLIFWKVYVTVVSSNNGLDKRGFLLTFAGLIIFSGFICFVLESDWFLGISPFIRVPIYTVLGLSISFAIAFSLVDILNYISGLIVSNDTPLLVDSKAQIVFVVCSSLFIGIIFGFLFGLVEDSHEQIHYVNISLMKQKHYCYTIGIIVGALCGFGNEVIRLSDKSYMIVGKTVYDSDV